MDTKCNNLGSPQKTPPTLQQITERVLINWRSSISDLGDVPYYLIHPVLKECSAAQLAHIEHLNPHILDEDDELWQPLCLKDFFEVRQEHDSNTLPTVISWRDLYMEHEHNKHLKFEQWSKKLKERYAQVHNQKKHTIYTEDVPPPPRVFSSGWAAFRSGERKTTRGFSIAAKARAETRQISSIYRSNTNPDSGYRRRKDTTSIGTSNGFPRTKYESPHTSRYPLKPVANRSPQTQSPSSERIMAKTHSDSMSLEKRISPEIKRQITSDSIFRKSPSRTPASSKVFSSDWNVFQSSISESNFKRPKTNSSVIRKIRSEARNESQLLASPPSRSYPQSKSAIRTRVAGSEQHSPTYNVGTIKPSLSRSPSSSNRIQGSDDQTGDAGSNPWCSPEVDASFFAMLHGKKPPKKLKGSSN